MPCRSETSPRSNAKPSPANARTAIDVARLPVRREAHQSTAWPIAWVETASSMDSCGSMSRLVATLRAHHVPDQPGRFLCKSSDLLRLTAKPGDPRQRMEMEANRFASLVLMPPPLLRGAMEAFREPDLQHVLILARDFAVGKEVAARAYVQYHPERIAIVVAGNGRVQRCYRSLSFPAISCAVGSPVPTRSHYHVGPHRLNIASDIAACSPDLWIDVKRDLRAPALYEQVYLQQNGFAMILLRLEPVPEDNAEERRLEEGWRHRFHSGRR